MPQSFIINKYGIKKSSNISYYKMFGLNVKIQSSFIKNKIKSKLLKITKNKTLSKKLYDNIDENVKFLKKIKSYKGIRHKNNYPVRGQRTHTNATKKKKIIPKVL